MESKAIDKEGLHLYKVSCLFLEEKNLHQDNEISWPIENLKKVHKVNLFLSKVSVHVCRNVSRTTIFA